MRGQPLCQAGQAEGEELLGFGAVQRGVGRARGASVFLQRAGLDSGLQLRPAGGEELADLPARQPLAAGDVIEAWLASGCQFPNRPRRDLGREWASGIRR